MERVKSGTKPLFIIERSDAATDDLTEDWTVTSTTLAPDSISNFVYSSVFKDLEYVPIDGGRYAITGTLDANAIPEPSAWALLTLGVCGLLCWRKRKN